MSFMRQKENGAGDRRHWRSRELDVDPYMLPAAFAVPFQPFWRRLCGFIRYVTIYRDRVCVQDSSPPFGVWEWEAPVSDFEGVSLVIAYRGKGTQEPVILVELKHLDPRKSVTLHASFDGIDAGARWRSWSAQLGLPLLVEDRDGETRMALERFGALVAAAPQPHRGASPLTARRPLSFGYTGRPRRWSDRVITASRPHAY